MTGPGPFSLKVSYMQPRKISLVSRAILVLGAVALVAVLRFPMWRIDLDAPQYPEGLRLLIYPDHLGGNVDIINGLNHYIGMKTLHTEDFIEFAILPWIIGFFAAAFLAAAIAGRKKWMNLLFVLFVLFGIVAMIDFWRWEYNYGHNLDPNAAIVVPGMAYQPPLIGFKQLLNFGAYSIPDIGGCIFIGSGILLLTAVLIEWRKKGQEASKANILSSIILLIGIFTLSSCTSGPVPIKAGADQCHFCKMTISDTRFSAELLTNKGKVYVFDDIHCMMTFRKSAVNKPADVREYYFSDFSNPGKLIDSKHALFLSSADLHSPMGGNIAAFADRESLDIVNKKYPGQVITFQDILSK